jgi:hypothetical protein
MPAIQSLTDKLERVAVANDLAGYLGVETGLVLEQFRKSAADRTARVPVAAPNLARKADRILIPLLLNNAGNRAQLIAALRPLDSIRQGAAAPLYEAIVAMQDAGENISFNSVHERLGQAQQELLSALVLDATNTSACGDDGLAAIGALQREEHEARRRELMNRIRAAEREGRLAEAMDLTRQLSRFRPDSAA